MSPRGSRVVAIVGRPNVGKSTLFNALIGRRVAIVDDQPGVTRDRVYHSLSTASGPALLVDTGGLLIEPRDGIELGVREQALLACEEADVVLLVVDGRVPPTTDDEAIARLLGAAAGRTVVIANKIDTEELAPQGLAYVSLGLGEPLLTAALGRRGLTEVRDRIARSLPPARPLTDGAGAVSVAIVGKPNVGKSSLLNRLVGVPRAVVHEQPGTTRDPIDMVVNVGGVTLRLIDTAGIRRRSRHDEGVAYYSYLRSLAAIEQSDVAALLVDATAVDIEIVEVKLAEQTLQAGKGLVVVVNKWDLVAGGDAEHRRWRGVVADRLAFARHPPLRCVSARTGRGVGALPRVFAEVSSLRSQTVPQERLDQVLHRVMASNPPPANRGRLNRLHRITQEKGPFPRFVVALDDPDGIPISYLRYLRNTLGEELSLHGIGFHLTLKRHRRGR